VLQRIADGARALCRSDGASIFLREGDTLRPRYRVGPWPEIYQTLRIRSGESIGGEVMLTGKPTRSEDYASDPRVPPSHTVLAQQTGMVCVMVVPIVIRTQVAGLLYISNRTRRVFTDEDETVCTRLAEQAAIAIQNAELFAREAAARQEAESANHAKDEFLAMLGHELRNPLGAISNAAHVMGLVENAGPLVESAQGIISRQVVQLGRVVDDLLDVSRVTSGKIALDRRPLDLAALARRVIALIGVSTHAVSVDAAEVWVDADAARLEQVVVNLLENARKYTPAGGEIRVLVMREGDDAVLSIRDSGVGIDPALLPRVFDLFVQGDRSLDRSKGGLGIGLTLVRRLIEQHGGAVAVASEGTGMGSTFTVRLRAVSRPADSQAPAPAPRPAVARRVLVIEDNDDSRQMLGQLIRLLGHEVYEAVDGVSGVSSALKLAPDLALVDVGLPGIDGYEVARRLREHPGGRHLRLVALTGYGLPEDRERARTAGFDLHLVKPVDPARIAELLADGL
jgi:signal transduction histidine kinase